MNKSITKVIASAIALTFYACGSNSTSPEETVPSSSETVSSSSTTESSSSSSKKSSSSSAKESSSSSEAQSSSSEIQSSSSEEESSSSEKQSSSSEEESSSSKVESSSSEEESSSSSEPSSSSAMQLETGVLIDSRDNQSYKTIKIGTANWMAENLNYNFNDGYGNGCQDGDDVNCTKNGRLYSIGTAMDSSAVFSSHGRRCGATDCDAKGAVRGICPEGWRLPNKTDFQNLIEKAGGPTLAGMNLKAKTSWTESVTANPATDLLGFSMLATGYADPYHYDTNIGTVLTLFYDQGTKGAIFSSDYSENYTVHVLQLKNSSDEAEVITISRELWVAVRCVESTSDDVFYDIPDPFANIDE